MNIDLINIIIKSFFINTFSFTIFLKINNCKNMKIIEKVELAILVILTTFLYCILKTFLDSLGGTIVLCFVETIFLSYVTKLQISRTLISTMISTVIVYFLLGFAVTIEFFIQKIFNIENRTINILLICLIELILILLVLRIKRLKNGLAFLKKENEYIDIAIINISAIMMLLYGLIGNELDKIKHVYFYFIILGIFMIIIFQKTITMCYKQNLMKKEIEEYEEKLKQKSDEIKKLSNEKYEISRINHEFYNRQKALELKVREMTEASGEIGILDRIENLSKEYSNNLEKIKGKESLPLTNIPEIDDMFRYMQTECYNNNIDFKLKIESEIYYLINNIIPKNKLETLIGDHLRNAIIAINCSDNKNKSILTIFGIKDKCYELCIYDSGIEFEIETLLKLGKERATTHKETGGSGIGFMTTFETLKECKASLIIEEKHGIKETDYTKAVKVRFDGKNEYKICSYRAEKIKEKNKDKKILVEKA